MEFGVPRPLLKQYSKLPQLPASSQTLALDISQGVLHVFVHHLFANTYQSLRPKGKSDREKTGVELSTAVHVYAFARKYEIPSLEQLARIEIESLRDEVHFSVFLGILQDAYPVPEVEDVWLSAHIKARLKSVL